MSTRLIHISDLHFGRDRPELMRPLLAALNDLAPDVVAISGDLTQRARASQFRAARTFIDHIEAPVLCVPGNHDLPVHRPFRRFFRPFSNYRKHISPDLSPAWMSPDLALIGINTMSPWRWQTGWRRRALPLTFRQWSGSRGNRASSAPCSSSTRPETPSRSRGSVTSPRSTQAEARRLALKGRHG